MVVWWVACADPALQTEVAALRERVDLVEQQVVDQGHRLDAADAGLDRRVTEVEAGVEAARAQLEAKAAAAKAAGALSGPWSVRSAPFTDRGCGDTARVDEYEWQLTVSDGAAEVAVTAGTTNFPRMSGRVEGSVLAVVARNGPATATITLERAGEELKGFRVFTNGECTRVYRVSATRLPAR